MGLGKSSVEQSVRCAHRKGTTVWHGLNGIQKKIKKHLIELSSVGLSRPKIDLKTPFDSYVLFRSAEELQCLPDQLI